MKPRKLPYQKFLESFKYAPRPAVNLLIERNMEVSQTSNRSVKFAKLNTKAVLLTKRKKPPFAGYWHLPGSFVLKGVARRLLEKLNQSATPPKSASSKNSPKISALITGKRWQN